MTVSQSVLGLAEQPRELRAAETVERERAAGVAHAASAHDQGQRLSDPGRRRSR